MADTPVARDVNNHILFEVATEVANRGEIAYITHSTVYIICELTLR